jgi:hypothetical protein
MMPQLGQEPERPPDLGGMLERAGHAIGAVERSWDALLRRAPGDGDVRAVLAATVALRDLTRQVDAAMVAAAIGAARELRELAAENARLRADLEEAARLGRRGRHAGERPPWLRAVRPAAPLAAVPVGLRLLGHHAAAKAVIGSSAVAASAVLVIGAGVSRPVPYETPAPAGHSAFRAPSADPFAAVRIPRAAAGSSPRARTAAQSASPAPVAVPSPRTSSAPSATAPPSFPAPGPVLDVPRLLDFGAVTRGPLVLHAGDQAVTWTLRATDGITASAGGAAVTGGMLAAGQELDLTVFAPLGGGWIYVSFGGTTVPVEVTSDLGGTPAP